MSSTVSVCICTYKRPKLLGRALAELEKQHTGGKFTFSIVIADNDRHQSSKSVVDAFRAGSLIETTYCVEPEQNIALARNKALENATGNYVAFIDDDEFPAADWLAALVHACENYGADGVLGPVMPWFDEPPPKWIIQGKFCERPQLSTGVVLEWKQTRTGNVLFRRQLLRDLQPSFRREFGNGGEDQDFFRRLIEKGRTFIWCNEAIVYEVVPPERWKRSYMFRRALLRGQNERLFLTPGSIGKSVLAVFVYAVILPFTLLLPHHIPMNYAVRFLDHFGKLLAAIGLRPLGEKYLS